MMLRSIPLLFALGLTGVMHAQEPPVQPPKKLSRAQRFKDCFKNAVVLTYQQELARRQQSQNQTSNGQRRVLTTHDVTGAIVK